MVLAANVKLTNREIWIVFIGLLVGNFLSALDQTIRRIQRRAAEQATAGPR